jgi:glycosyltransferase involved in cell wall biosynthesis
VYPDGIATGGFVKRTNLIFKVWASMAKYFYKKANSVYAISEGIAKKVEQYCPQYKIEVIPLWANKDICRVEKTDNLFIKKYNLSEKFVILYSGNIGKGSNIKVLIELAKILKANQKIQFVVIGEGMENHSLRKL